MSVAQTEYFSSLAAAFVRGTLARTQADNLPRDLLFTPIAQLSAEQMQTLIECGKEQGLKVHKFKKTAGLSRVRSVLGILRGLQPTELLDIGSGRGVFLWPFLDEFSSVPVTCVDANPLRVRDIRAVHEGGIEQVNALEGDITKLELAHRSFDVVTFLEVLEHIPNAQEALSKALSVAKRFVVLSVPSHEDDNEEHIHLFTKDSITRMLMLAGAHNVNVQFVLNHMIVVAKCQPV